MSVKLWPRLAFAVTALTTTAPVQAQALGAGMLAAPSKPASSAPATTSVPAPTAPAPAATPAPPAASAPEKAASALDKSGIVLVERAGQVVALGAVLNGDGRVLTSLSRLGTGQLFVRYTNGNAETVRIGHSDASRDLALLVPKTAKNQKGVKAADGPLPQGSAKLTGFALGPNRNLTPQPQTLQGLSELNGHAVLKLGTVPKPAELGAPLLDERGDAAAIVVSGCAAGTAGCTAPPVALPVSEVRAFLRTRPASAGFQLPRLGIVGRSADNGVVRGLWITSVDPQSPASALGLNANDNPEVADVLVAIGGNPVPTEDALRGILARHAPGDRLDLLVFGKGAYRTLNVRLGPPAAPSPAAPVAPQPPAAPKAKAAPSAPIAPTPPKAPVPPPAPTTPTK
ncbi:MAG TPA: PDZ domain-containing protein [Polyangiaceae bacterium]|nr:PDZ domain-containing protein [Polyangiaceae bacterium]